jgi:cytochrome c553
MRSVRALLVAMLLAGITALPALAASMEERLAPCLACHGETGASTLPDIPSLGAQKAPYVLIQLFMFREKLRIVEIMNDQAKGLTNEDLRAFADAIAKLPPPPPSLGAVEVARMERGRDLVRRHRCDFCHDPDLGGRENVPRIAGQREDFLVKTMREYKSNTRTGYDASMADVLQPLTDAEILDLAYFAARQP